VIRTDSAARISPANGGCFLPRANFLTKTAKVLLLRYRRSKLAQVAADGGQWDLQSKD
jgi:hypothetical protein